MSEDGVLLSVKDLSVSFFTEDGVARAVQRVSFSVRKGRTFALVGESGCGKTTTALSIMRLMPTSACKIVSGEIIFEGRNLLELSNKQMRRVHGNKVAMIFQHPNTSLNPVCTVGEQIVEAITLHQNKTKSDAKKDAVKLLANVEIAEPQLRINDYPHHLSGGMQQRIMIAMAVSCSPELLIADEPTTALDVTVQAQILDLLDDLQKQSSMSILLITHDLGIVAERADEVAVMYASRIVETADSHSLFSEPLHPYTKGLLKSLPSLNFQGERLHTIPGNVPEPLHFPTGCKFHPRCPKGRLDKRCQTTEPILKEMGPGHCVACWHPENSEKLKR